MLEQIVSIGYVPRFLDVHVTLTGKIVKEGDLLLLQMDDVTPGPQMFELVRAGGKSAQDHKAQDRLFQELEAQVGKIGEIEGVWRSMPKGKTASGSSSDVRSMLLVTRFHSETHG